jgi:hypothetical protein
MKRVSKLFILLTVLVLSQCREPFEPDFLSGVNDYLVVEGFINVGDKAVTQIKLSRVTPLESGNKKLEEDALVRIQGSDGELYLLHKELPGSYKSDSISLDAATQYRLLITQKNGTEYESDFETAIPTPAIDSIYWRIESTGVNILLATHANANGPRFFSWNYVETWEIQSDYKTLFKYVNGEVKRRSNAETTAMRFCWKYDYPGNILFGSTEQLNDNVMNYSLNRFSHYSERILVRYSILAEQRAIAEDEYRYLQLIEKNSSSTGSLFDPMPSEIHGNLVCKSSPETPVIGYVGVSMTTSKRIFVLASELDLPRPNKCKLEIINEDEFTEFFEELGYAPVDSLGIDIREDPRERPVYSGAPVYCIDCRFRGTSERPDFW